MNTHDEGWRKRRQNLARQRRWIERQKQKGRRLRQIWAADAEWAAMRAELTNIRRLQAPPRGDE